jgi:hypothetical protein
MANHATAQKKTGQFWVRTVEVLKILVQQAFAREELPFIKV